MTSLLRLQANRLNAQKSTGPRTPIGKSLSRLNALQHGIRAALPVLTAGESRAEWDVFAAAIAADLQPVGMLETLWVGRIALLQWRLHRSTAARQILLDQQSREAILTVAQTPWWQHRRQQLKNVPASLEDLRKHLNENRRCQRLLARITAGPPTVGDPVIDAPTAVELITWAAAHISRDDSLTRDLDENRFPGLGVLTDFREPADFEWKLSYLHAALTEIAGWIDLPLEDLIATLAPALKAAFNAMLRQSRRGARELKNFRRCTAARLTDESKTFDAYEADLERRLARAIDQLHRLQFQRGSPAALDAPPLPSNSVPMGFATPETPEILQ